MPILVVLLTLMLFPLETLAHPGKTNYQGGHRCLKGCAEWDLLYGEYHLHDKNGKAIRVAKKSAKKAREKPAPAEEPVSEAAAAPVAPVLPRPVAAAAVPENNEFCLSSLPAGGLLALLLLWLLVRRRRARERGGA